MWLKVIITIGLIIISKGKIIDNELKWIQSLTKNIQKDPYINQVIFFHSEETVTSNPIVHKIIKDLSKNTPLLKMSTPNYDKPTVFDFTIYNPRISLFILTNFENNDKFNQTIKFLIDLSESNRRPKCLLLLFQEFLNYRKLFENLWSLQFLDFTVLEIEKEINQTNLNVQVKNPCRVFIYNPFVKLLTNEIPNGKTVWFPDKLKNMFGYPLIASLENTPPDVFVPKKEFQEVYGFAVTKLKVMSEIINFTLVRSPITDWGILTCAKEGSSGISGAIFTNEIDIMGVEVSVGFCSTTRIGLSKSMTPMRIGIIVPLIKKHVEYEKYQWQIKNIFTVVLLPLLFLGISRFLSFCPNKWRGDYMFRITLGNPIPEEPETRIERIIFLTFLIGCFMFSSEIFTAINKVQLEAKVTYKYESLEDVVASKIEVHIHRNYYFMLLANDDILLQQMLKNSVIMKLFEEDCLEELLKFKNISCVMELRRAEVYVRNKKDKCGQPVVKLFNDRFPSDSGAMLLSAGVPYAKRFDQVLQRAIDSGVKEKWLEPYLANIISNSKKMNIKEINL